MYSIVKGINRRISKTLPATGITAEHYYSDNQVIQEYENNIPKRSYLYGNYIDDVVAIQTNNQTYYYLKDRQYNIKAIIDSQGGIIESYSYNAYGIMTITDGNGNTLNESTIGNTYGYTGRRYDKESKLWYYRNRMYSAELGRFLQRDPKGYVDGINLYAYVRNNPHKLLDPMGTMSLANLNAAVNTVSDAGSSSFFDKVSDTFSKISDGLGKSLSTLWDKKEEIGGDVVEAVTNAHPAAQAVFTVATVGAATAVAVPTISMASEAVVHIAITQPETVAIGTEVLIGILDPSPPQNVLQIIGNRIKAWVLDPMIGE